MFVVAEFLSEEAVEVVPQKWLLDNSRTYWPPTKFRKEWGNFIKKQLEPESTWVTYPITILSTANSYEEARHKAAKAKEGSDKLTSDPECYGRGKRKRVYPISSSSDEESHDNPKLLKILEQIPMVPQTPTQNAKVNQTPDISFHELSFLQSVGCKSDVCRSPSPQPQTSTTVEAFSRFLSEKPYEVNPPSDKREILRKEKNRNSTGNHDDRSFASTPKPKKDVLETILRNQKYMQLELRGLREDIGRLTDKNLKVSTSQSVEPPDFGSFPLNDEQNMKILEERLEVGESSAFFVCISPFYELRSTPRNPPL